MSGQRCNQPGCGGTIVDGYCDVCGMPATAGPGPSAPEQPRSPFAGILRPQAAPSQTAPSQTAASQAAPAASEPVAEQSQKPELGIRSGACPQPGCRGTIVDGYCNLCGQPPVVTETPNVLGTKLNQTTSATLGSVLIGSARLEPGSQAKPAPASTGGRTRIGAGITTVPPAPTFDPADAILKDPVVPANRRSCPNCGKLVGQPSADKPAGEVSGVCENCGTPFDFHPPIKPGDLISGQYEVGGCLAYGGMGWIYLARDRNVSDRWVVLKGLLNVNDADASAAAKSEQEFLAAVEHPLIVEIYNFVEHDDARYIVMEYVPGRSITELLKERRAQNKGVLDPLPVDWALAYLIEILPAFTYLHETGLLYCDFKPDNLMQVGDALKLIDLGAVRRIDDQDSPIFGTVGYQAPEVAKLGPSIASDIYTLGRALVVMCSDFKGYQTEYVDTLPPAHKLPVFDTHDSLYRLAQRACAPVREDRFQSAEELRLQCLGVLREIVGRHSNGAALTSTVSTLFSTPTVVDDADVDWRSLPQLRADGADPMHEWLTALSIDEPKRRFAALSKAPQRSRAVILAQIQIALQLGDQRSGSKLIAEMLKNDPWEWRAVWMQGLLEVQAGRWSSAVPAFNTVYSQLPGELAPKFALAVACERADAAVSDDQMQHVAEELFAVCASSDAAYVTPSAFGLARLRKARGDDAGALDALALVPPSSRAYTVARERRARMLIDRGQTLPDLAAALDSVREANLPAPTQADFEITILERALAKVQESGPALKVQIGGRPATARNIRPQLEDAYRVKARWATDDSERNRLLTHADTTRRWSLW